MQDLSEAITQAILRDEIVKESFRNQLEKTTNLLMQDELTAFLGYEAFHRPTDRENYRNGFYARKYVTQFGVLALKVPRDRAGRFEAQTLTREQEANEHLIALTLELCRTDAKQREINARIRQLFGPYYPTATITLLIKTITDHHHILQQRRQQFPYAGVYEKTLPLETEPDSAQLLKLKFTIKSVADFDDEVMNYVIETSYRAPQHLAPPAK